MWGELHEEKTVCVMLPSVWCAQEGHRVFSELGATLFDDVYGFALNPEEVEDWQSETLLDIVLMFKGREVTHSDKFDQVVLSYLFASRPIADQCRALELIEALVSMLGGIANYGNEAFSMEAVRRDWDRCNEFLYEQWREEPGSEQLAIMIEENYT
ncbi:hypothetical protein [Ferrimonas balearica]|uniref:hypothetical protein n=1 Tax=Ferrimonas balearica TaxID=44012 RepID=UPI001C99A254|nr:hypothetical protein [Ferrimonas balearica]MBY5991154.1 hypothetical protein [Ferrimonas balearica]